MDPIRRVKMPIKIALAREMRRHPSSLERAAWSLLRNRGILGLKFRRQHIIAGFIVDFVCLRARLILEIDGPHHAKPQQAEYDRARTEHLRAAGFTVLHVKPRELSRQSLETVLLPYSPSPAGRGGKGVRTKGEGAGGKDQEMGRGGRG